MAFRAASDHIGSMIADKPLGFPDLAQLLALNRYAFDRPLRQTTLVAPPIPP
jgi:hypothetical protein